jgi:hypothetical protein
MAVPAASARASLDLKLRSLIRRKQLVIGAENDLFGFQSVAARIFLVDVQIAPLQVLDEDQAKGCAA